MAPICLSPLLVGRCGRQRHTYDNIGASGPVTFITRFKTRFADSRVRHFLSGDEFCEGVGPSQPGVRNYAYVIQVLDNRYSIVLPECRILYADFICT